MAQAIEVIADRFAIGGRLVYAGAGTSGRLGVLDASECPPTFNSPPGQVIGVIAGGYQALTTAVEGAEDHPEFATADLEKLSLSAKDVLVGIATSGRTPYVIGALRHARSVGAYAIGLACVPDSDLAAEADLMITPLVGAEVVTGSTPTQSRHRDQAGPEHAHHRRHGPARQDIWQPDGRSARDQREAESPNQPDCPALLRLGSDERKPTLCCRDVDGELKTALVVGRTGLTPHDARDRLRIVADESARCSRLSPRTRSMRALSWGSTVVERGRLRCSDKSVTVSVNTIGSRRGRTVQHESCRPAANAFAEIDRAVDQAFADANRPRGPVAAACLGLAGAGRKDDQTAVRALGCSRSLGGLASKSSAMWRLPIAMLPEPLGCRGRGGHGVVRLGPGGRRTNDAEPAVGVRSWATREAAMPSSIDALKSICRIDRPPASRDDIERAASCKRWNSPMRPSSFPPFTADAWDRTRLAGLARDVVIQLADEGDADAEEIIIRQVGELAGCVSAAITAAGIAARCACHVALAGGLMMKATTYRTRFVRRL